MIAMVMKRDIDFRIGSHPVAPPLAEVGPVPEADIVVGSPHGDRAPGGARESTNPAPTALLRHSSVCGSEEQAGEILFDGQKFPAATKPELSQPPAHSSSEFAGSKTFTTSAAARRR
jgi:hypothetical protein